MRENKRFLHIFMIQLKKLRTPFWCVPAYEVQNYRNSDTRYFLFFGSFFLARIEVPELWKMSKLEYLDVVFCLLVIAEFRINSDFYMELKME